VTIVVDISPVVDYSSDEQWFYILIRIRDRTEGQFLAEAEASAEAE